jgi:hypothetical protein
MGTHGNGWAVEKHPKGGLRVRDMQMLIDLNKLRLERGEAEGWCVVGWAPDLESAREVKRKIGRKE